ncbi:hypothetical protein QBC42DRAFT_338114 [Cladorrhinum samala]|uniref:NAD-dependent epimerase/dehydratase domain-containing protein n=1 Tax=Cladorrhinum samala TaxID=585594 RepID=A0AAV9HPD0_9PEZI|nr:hypothetical protein QBC42DRAFT_338114 [Cladorrhinum samala]
MHSSTTTRILLTGATGFVGGTLLHRLVNSEDATIRKLTFDALVRTDEAAEKLKNAYGDRVSTIKWAGLTDAEFIADTAANYDIVINVGSGFILDGALAFVRGLARRVKPGAPAPWILQISGCTNLADKPLTGTPYPDRVWDDADSGAVYEYERAQEAIEPYPQRSTEVGVLTLADELGVNAVSLNTPLIFGEGQGLFNRQGIIIPVLMRYTLMHGHGFKLTDTANFDWVHVEDLADAYILLVKLILERQDRAAGLMPTGKKGILFPAVDRALQTEIFERCLDAAFAAGLLPREDTPKEKTIREVPLREIADEITAGLLAMAEQGWGGNKAQKGTVLKKLGWQPKHLHEAWAKDFADELTALKEGRRPYTLDSCIGVKQ